MKHLKNIFYQSCSFLPMEFLQKRSPVTTLLPYHHTVSNGCLPHISHLYSYKNVRQFKDDLDTLLRYNKPISADELALYLSENKEFPKKTFLLSFDDGFRECFDVIAPILEAKGIPAVFFINPAFIDNKSLFFRCKTSLLINELINSKNDKILNEYCRHFHLAHATQTTIIETLKNLKINDHTILDDLANKIGYSFSAFLNKQQPYLTSDQLLSLKTRGFSIGGHSMTHPYYDQISFDEQIEQTIQSCNYVKEKTEMASQFFSFPFDDKNISQQLLDELKKSEIDLLFGLQNQKNEISNKMLHRFNAERDYTSFSNQIKGILLLSIFYKFLKKNNVLRD
jgi:peptidoglycan/xylan/chitin deacetylase (PgdA/CDA1 family)